MRRKAVLPLTVWVCVVVVATAAAVLIAVAAVIGLNDTDHRTGLLAGAAVGIITAVAAALAVRPVSRAAEALSLSATRVRAAEDDKAEIVRAGRFAAYTTEFDDLVRAIAALQRRTALAESVADQASRSAEMTSAGMFELLSGLVAAEEATRGQLAAELHDTAAQTLMRAKSELSDPTQWAHLDSWERVRALVDDAEEELRAAMARARPPELRDGDLGSAVAGLRREMAARYLLDVRLEWPPQQHPLPLATAVAVYRFFQEALLNVVKHADVDEVDARLEVLDAQLIASVVDHGDGFDPRAVSSAGGRHVGLGLLRERARLAGGTLVVESMPGAGTAVRLLMPATAQASLLADTQPVAIDPI